MSITTENNRTAELTTDGSETEFDFLMLIHAGSEVEVWYEVTGGSYTQLTLNTDYTVVFTEAGGTVTTIGGSSPYAAGKILIIRNIALTQQTNWLYNDSHSEQQHQDDFDRSVMRDLQIQEQLDRAVGFAIHSSTKDIEFPEPSSDKMIGWNTAATALENKTPESAFVIGITDGDILQVDGTPNSGEYAKFTANGLEGKTFAEMATDLEYIKYDTFAVDTYTLDTAGITLTAGTLQAEQLASDTHIALLDMGTLNFLKIRALDSAYNASKFLDIDLGNDNRTLTITGDPTIADWFDQSVKTSAAPTFLTVTIGSSTGVKLSASSGTLALGGIGGSNNENIIFDFEGTADTVGLSSSSDATKFDFGSFIDITMPGHLLTLGDDTANDIVIDFKGNSYDGKITYDESAGIFEIDTGRTADAELQIDSVGGYPRFASKAASGKHLAFRSDTGYNIFQTGGTFCALQIQPASTSYAWLRFYEIGAGSYGRITTQTNELRIDPATHTRINGDVRIGSLVAPTVALDVQGSAPYQILHNTTHEDTDGGGESKITHRREDGAGTDTDCFQFEASHDGSGANDQLGKGVWSVNTGSGLVEAMRIDSAGVVSIPGIGGNGLIGYDLKVGDTTTPDYGLIQTGNACFGRVPYNAMSMDLDGVVIIRNLGVPATSKMEFAFLESGGTSIRFALAKSAAGNATYSPRSMLIAGPAVWDDEIVTVSYWQGQGIFDNLACDVAGDGADLGVQNDLEVEGDIFADSIKESTSGAGISFANYIALKGNEEIRLYDNGNYVGFEAPALSANQIWVLPTADGDPGAVLTTDGSGTTSWTDNASEKTWAFMSRDASSGTNYIGGFYKFGGTDNDFNPSITFGTANISYAAHFFLVQAAGASGGTDTVIRVTGTSINDQGTRAAAATEDLTVDDAGSAGTYYETTKKWIGQVTIEKQSGPDLLCDYGFCKYWDNNNTAFKVAGIEATWLGAKNDANPDIELRHHKSTGWTYNAGAAPTPPAAIASMATDHNTEIQIATAEEGAWKRDNLSTNIDGSSSEGTIIELTTTTNRTYAIGNFLIRITPQ